MSFTTLRTYVDKCDGKSKCDKAPQTAFDINKQFIDGLDADKHELMKNATEKDELKKIKNDGSKENGLKNWFVGAEDLRVKVFMFDKYRSDCPPLACRHLYRAFSEADHRAHMSGVQIVKPDGSFQGPNLFFGFATQLKYVVADTGANLTHVIRLTPKNPNDSINDVLTKKGVTVQLKDPSLESDEAIVGLKAEGPCYSVGFGDKGTTTKSARRKVQELIAAGDLLTELVLVQKQKA